jgi:hypothetical protein
VCTTLPIPQLGSAKRQSGGPGKLNVAHKLKPREKTKKSDAASDSNGGTKEWHAMP